MSDASSTLIEKLNEYVKMDTDACDGGVDAIYEGCDGGVDGVLLKLSAVTDDPTQYPNGDDKLAAIRFARLVAMADLEPAERVACDTFMLLCRDDVHGVYERGIKQGVQMSSDSAVKGKASSAKETKKCLEEYGMKPEEQIACTHAMFMSTVPSPSALAACGLGDDPTASAEYKQRAKLQLPVWRDYCKKKDAEGLRSFFRKGGRALNQRGYVTASATVTTLVQEVSEMTIDQHCPQLFVAYFEELFTENPGGCMRAYPVLNQDVLQRTVLGVKLGASETAALRVELEAERAARALAASEGKKAALELTNRISNLSSTVKELKEAMKANKVGGGPAPPATGETKCYNCGGFGHYSWNCPEPKRGPKVEEVPV